MKKGVSMKQLERYPIYLNHLMTLRANHVINTSAPQMAKALGYSEEQVRKDLQLVTTTSGKPKAGRVVNDLITDIDSFLGYDDVTSAVIIGVGHLGEAFMKYQGFEEFGLEVLAGFDVDSSKVGKTIYGKEVFGMNRLENLIPRLNVHIAILTTPSEVAQEVVDRLIQCGIRGIWNFVPVHIDTPESVVVENVNLASSLAILSHKLNNKIKEI